MAQSELLRLRRIVVDGLFNIYDHDIRLNLDDRVTLLHGPNGVGKTVVLGMIDALLRGRLGHIKEIPFSRFFLEFHDGSTIELAGVDKEVGGDTQYELKLSSHGKVHLASVDRLVPADQIAAKIDYLRPHPEVAQTWIDVRDDEVLDASEVTSRYSEMLEHGEEDTKWFDLFLEHARAHFIEAQRLVRMDWNTLSRFNYMRPRRRESTMSAVDGCSEHFRKRIADTMVRYGREAQALDQSFPQRLISATDELG